MIGREQISETRRLIAPYVRYTPVLAVQPGDFGVTAGALALKLEFMQYTGSFKVRGAFANLLLREIPPAGVVAASGGNHGIAVALAARRLGVPAHIFVPSVSSPAKIRLIRELGADLAIVGDRYADALEASERFVAESGGLPVHAFNQRETVLGQGTIGLELEADAPDIDTVLVAVGGGGLIGGIASWYQGRARVVAVEPELAPTMRDALSAGQPVDAPAGGIAADSLAPRRVGEVTFSIARQHVHSAVVVPDDAIRAAQRALWDAARIVAEPGGATALAALMSGRYRPQPGERIAIILCGANSAAVDFDRA